uniref:Density-regulated protein n=1 Tax=Lynceus sp. MCZ IZ 141354 TaxID=1930659 RepID=A0A9N6WRS6_9CRUS|nr:EOG090X0IUZ [Lynceus sp. MCZ IZ 141354]
MSDEESKAEVAEAKTLKSYITESGLPVGPQPGATFPVKVVYCGNCGVPTEYCEFYADYEKCKQWLEKNLPEEFEKMFRLTEKPSDLTTGDKEGEDDGSKRQKRGGKGLVKPKKKEEGPKQICLSLAPRGKKKHVTVITGLKGNGIDLKVAAKFFGTKFACGASVTGDDEIVVQGDVKDDLVDLLPEKWPQIDEDSIEDLGELKR